jgi:hypothetical protein
MRRIAAEATVYLAAAILLTSGQVRVERVDYRP